LASDLTTAQNIDGTYNAILSVGVSKSSLMGDKSYSLNSMIWSTFNQFALSGGMTQLKLNDKGVLSSINSYSVTAAYLNGNYMSLLGYTWIKPHPKFGTFGYNVGTIVLVLPAANDKKSINLSTSGVVFWTKPYQYSKKLTVSPQTFIMFSPISYNTLTNETTVNRHFGFLVGSSFDYKLSKRFGLSLNYKLNLNTAPGSPMLSNFLIGSRMML